RPRTPPGTVLALSSAAVVIAGVLVWLAVVYASQRPDEANLGDPVFRVGRATRLAAEVAERGPALFKDPLNRGREIYLQHLGGTPEEGWLAFEAYAPGAARAPRCLLVVEGRRFRDPCGGSTFPADGTGLTGYPATVEAGTVVVDLRTSGGPRP
ncbi:MAG: hypothetical protein ACRD0D_09815, partial [Acidimicrobiales bacterium]